VTHLNLARDKAAAIIQVLIENVRAPASVDGGMVAKTKTLIRLIA
jgi:hypothetical protein